MEPKSKKITLYSYAKAWKVEKKIYNIQNIILPAPVNVWDAFYFGIAFLMMYFLQKMFPVLTTVPAIIRLGGIPFGVMYYTRKVKLDGKNPLKYFAGYFMYLLCDRRSRLERIECHAEKKERILLNWNCSEGYR